ncbi:MAG: cyclopropane-fatty-acyl-phospholipid synthase family protein [Sphingomonadales bacterium]
MKSQTLTLPLIAASARAARWLPSLSAKAGERAVELALARVDEGRVRVTFPDGRRITCGAGPSNVTADLIIQAPGFYRRILTGGTVGFAEGFVDGDWDSPDLPRLLRVLAGSVGHVREQVATHWLVALGRRLGHRRNANSRRGSQRNIAFHYDLGNDFYGHWLDRSMTYSAALFETPDMPLEAAQAAKYHRLARVLDLKPGQHVLEIGCGWGGFAEIAARDYGCRVTALTLSREQEAHARQRMADAGLADRVDIRLQDYRDARGTYDAIASIEMFEAVGEDHWPIYFDVVRDRLKPGGRAGLQVITIDNDGFAHYRNTPDFIQSYIFPGGMLPSPRVLEDRIRDASLHLTSSFTFGADYARTLVHWRNAFTAAWPEIHASGFDDRFRRIWLYYLAYCEAGFHAGRIDVGHYLIERNAG